MLQIKLLSIVILSICGMMSMTGAPEARSPGALRPVLPGGLRMVSSENDYEHK
jgi:hypothetical protein